MPPHSQQLRDEAIGKLRGRIKYVKQKIVDEKAQAMLQVQQGNKKGERPVILIRKRNLCLICLPVLL
jgi:hypothetical protein